MGSPCELNWGRSGATAAYFSETLNGVVPSPVLPAQALFRKVMICPPLEVETPRLLSVITQSEIRAVAAKPPFWTDSPMLLEIILERSIRTWVAARELNRAIP